MTSKEKIVSKDSAQKQVLFWKEQGEKIVFTNGCFDLLHVGHVDYLEKARALGTKLVLGLNTDASVQRIKGPSRPVSDNTSRSRVIAALGFVDLVVFFDEETPLDLIKSLLPNVLVKGDDYAAENIVGYKEVIENGGEVLTVTLVDGYSTSALISKIKSED